MTFLFEPALQLAGTPTVFVRSLDDATGVLRSYAGHRPATRDSILRRLIAASSAHVYQRSGKELSLVGGARRAPAPAPNRAPPREAPSRQLD